MNDLSAPGSAKMNYINNNGDSLFNSNISNNKSPKTFTNDLNISKPKKVINEPIKLIDFSKGFKINEEALAFLRSIKDEIIIVSVIG